MRGVVHIVSRFLSAWWRSPIVLLVGCCLLVRDCHNQRGLVGGVLQIQGLESLFTNRGMSEPTYVQYGVQSASGSPVPTVPIAIYQVNGGVFHARWQDDRSQLPDGATLLSGCRFNPASTWRTGLWAMTSEHIGVSLESPSRITTGQNRQILAAILGVLASDDRAGAYWVERRLLSTGVMKSSRVLWAGYVHNGVVSMAIVWIAVAVASYANDGRRWLVAWRRRSRGGCLSCGYNLAGIRDRCPECGRALGGSEHSVGDQPNR